MGPSLSRLVVPVLRGSLPGTSPRLLQKCGDRTRPGAVLSDASCAVDALADEVGVAGVAGVLGNHVVIDPPQRDLRTHERTGLVESATGAVDPSLRDLVLPRRPSGVEGDVVGKVEAAVMAAGVGSRVVDGWHLLAQQDTAEPVPLDLGHVLYEPQQCQR